MISIGIVCLDELNYAHIWQVLTHDLLDNTLIDDITINNFLLHYYIKQIDSTMPWFCTIINHNLMTSNMVRTSVRHLTAS